MIKFPKLKPLQWLLVIIVIAAVLRIPTLNSNFAGDEIDTAGPARHFVTAGDFRQFDECNGTPYFNYSHPPMRLILYSAWSSIFGFSNIALRSLTLIFGLGSIVVIYFIGREMFSERAGLAAAFLAAITRYHIYASTSVNTDTGHFVFTTSAAFLFFILYMKKKNNLHAAASAALLAISLLTKFSAVIIFIPVLAASYFYRRKTGIAYTAIVAAISAMALFALSMAISPEAFSQPIGSFFSYAQGSHYTAGQYAMNKIFNLATITWQMTPFLAVLLALSLVYIKKGREFWILASWLIIGTLIVVYPYNQDSQRFFLVLLPPVFILTGKFIDDIKPSKITIAAAAAVAAFSLLIGLNDLMGYYEPFYLAVFYLIAAAALASRYRKHILLGGILGLGLIFAFTNSGTIRMGSDIIGDITSEHYPYNETWTSKDIAYYLTPENATVKNCYIGSLSPEYAKNESIKYIAFYSTVPRTTDIEKMEKYCTDFREIFFGKYKVGLVCRINSTAVNSL